MQPRDGPKHARLQPAFAMVSHAGSCLVSGMSQCGVTLLTAADACDAVGNWACCAVQLMLGSKGVLFPRSLLY